MKTRNILMAATALVLGAAAPAAATTVTIIGTNSSTDIASFLSGQGFTIKQNLSSSSGANYTGVDAVILLRTTGDAALASFVAAGGKLITEWSGSDWALNTAHLLNATDTGGGLVATGTTVSFTAAALAAGAGNGVGSSYSAGGSSEFFRNFSSLGSGVTTWATIGSGTAEVLAGRSGSGSVIIDGMDWADSFASSGGANQQVLVNYLNASVPASSVPEPASWAMMLTGFGAIGFAMRRRRTTVAFA